MGNRRNSNRPENCPMCFEELKTRFGAMSHYRAHARRGELVGRGASVDPDKHKWFRLPDWPEWCEFERGFSHKTYRNQPIEQSYNDWLRKKLSRRPGGAAHFWSLRKETNTRKFLDEKRARRYRASMQVVDLGAHCITF